MHWLEFDIEYIISICFVISVVAISIHILLTKHEEPTSAMMWLFVIFNFPVVGIILYLFFGINRLNTVGLRVESANKLFDAELVKSIHAGGINYQENRQKFAVKKYSDTTQLFNNTLDKIFPQKLTLSGNSIKLLQDGTMAYPAMLEAIEQAKHSIHLQSYIIMNDTLGKKILDTLARKAAEGVDVKVLYDRFGSYRAIFTHFFDKYTKKNSRLKTHAFSHSTLFSPWRVQLRNHRKLLVVDGRIAFTGGLNIGAANDPTKAKVSSKSKRYAKYIHDIHSVVEGPIVSELQFSFLRDWSYATNADPVNIFTEELFPVLSPCGDIDMRILDSGPGQTYKASFNNFMVAVSTAREQVLIMTPYFIPNKSFIDMLCFASARGVEVKIIVPATTDHWFAKYASQSYYKRLLKSGVRIFQRKGFFMHSKAMLIDGEVGVMGSSNCDNRSFRLNYELDFIATGNKFTSQLHHYFIKELAESEEVTLPDIAEKRIYTVLMENICSLISPIL